jgi:dihydrodipicolinate synthase/N-acetylneuraminate lyase
VNFRGVFAIPPTPFYPDGSIDEASFKNCIQFCLQSGAHGIVLPVNASEFDLLTDEERRSIVSIAMKEIGDQVPMIAGVTAPTTLSTVALARHAESVGAAGVIAMPPFIHKVANMDDLRYFYGALDAAVNIPIFIQNHIGPIGTPLSAANMAQLVKEFAHVQYIKEETDQSNHIITEVQQLAGPNLLGVMGGKAGRPLLMEYERGICGTMPACEIVDLQVELWNLLESGHHVEARAYYAKLLPLINFEALTGIGPMVYKEVLRRRGIIAHSTSRRPHQASFDSYDHQELTRILTELQSLMRFAEVAC